MGRSRCGGGDRGLLRPTVGIHAEHCDVGGLQDTAPAKKCLCVPQVVHGVAVGEMLLSVR
jgi:hypothetical protein